MRREIMAGFWIPWEVGLTRKREIVLIAKQLGITHREAAASCMEVWEWAQEQSTNGTIDGLSAEDISNIVRIPGIGEAMKMAGWLQNGNGMVHFPKWDRFNSKPAKQRLENAERQREYRAKKRRIKAENNR